MSESNSHCIRRRLTPQTAQHAHGTHALLALLLAVLKGHQPAECEHEQVVLQLVVVLAIHGHSSRLAKRVEVPPDGFSTPVHVRDESSLSDVHLIHGERQHI